MKQYPLVSIIFPNSNGGNQPIECLKSIKNLSYPRKKIEVIVVDNNSSDGSVEKMSNFSGKAGQTSNVKIIRNKKNEGFAKAINRGVKKTRGKYFFITNNDVILEKNCLRNLVEFLLKNPDVGIAGPKTYLRNEKTILHPAPHYNFFLGLFQNSKNPNMTQEADWIPGSGLCTSCEVWEKLVGFDEEFFFTYEDVDFCLRAKKLGYKIMYYPKAVMWHSDGATINRPEFRQFKYYYGYRGKIRVILKHANILQIITSLFLQFILFAPYRLIILKEESFIPLIKSFVWNFKNLPSTIRMRNSV